jgi:hypothetical protein
VIPFCEQHAADRIEEVLKAPPKKQEHGDRMERDVHLLALVKYAPEEAVALAENIPVDRVCARCETVIPHLQRWLGDRCIDALLRIACANENIETAKLFRTALSPLLVPKFLEQLVQRDYEESRAKGRHYLRRFGKELAPMLVALAAGADPAPLGVIEKKQREDQFGDPNQSIAWRAGYAITMLARMGREAEVMEAAKVLGLEKIARRFIAMPPILGGRNPKKPKLPTTVRLEGVKLNDKERKNLLGLLSRIDWVHARRDAETLREELDDKSRKAIADAFVKSWTKSRETPDRWVGQVALALDPGATDAILGRQKRQRTPWSRTYGEQALVIAMADCAVLHPEQREAMFACIGAYALDPVKVRAHLHRVANEALVDVAEELGLNPDTLDDRTIPSLGFDARGAKAIDWGGRAIEARMTPGLELVFMVDGEKKDAPPAPRKADDKTKIALAKKEVERLRKEGRILARGLSGRIERWFRDRQRWGSEEFLRDVVGHPVLRAIAQGFVWGSFDGPFSMTVRGTFRIAEDGTFANENDDQVQPSGRIGVVHPGEIDATLRQRWGTVLADYEILPIVPQLELKTLAEDQKVSDRIDHSSVTARVWNADRARVPPGWQHTHSYSYEDARQTWERELGRFRVSAFLNHDPKLYMRVRPIDCREKKWLAWGKADEYTVHEALVDLDAIAQAIAKVR